MNPSVLYHWNQIPPLFMVLIARENRRAIPLPEIAKRAGMSFQRAQWIYRQDTWDKVPVAEMDRFAAACGVTNRTFRRNLEYLRMTMRRPNPLAHIETKKPSTLRRMTRRVQEALG